MGSGVFAWIRDADPVFKFLLKSVLQYPDPDPHPVPTLKAVCRKSTYWQKELLKLLVRKKNLAIMTEDCQKSKRQQFRPDENRHKIGGKFS